MKATLNFDFDEPDDRMAHLRCFKSTDMALVLWDFLYNTVKIAEREIDEKKFDEYETLDYLMQRFKDLLDEHDINVNELIK